MENRNHGPRQSSLPSSLIPHLYSRPQHSDMPTSAFATTLPLPSSSGHESADFTERRELLPSMRTSFTLPPLSSVDTPRGQHYVNYHTRQSRQADPPQIHRAVSPIDIPLSLPSHLSSQHYGNTIHSDPQYHAVLPKRPYYGQSQNQNYQLPVPQEPGPPRGSWREGEAGPSSYIRTPYEARGSRGRRGSSQPAQSARLETYNFLGDMSDRGAESYPGALRQSSTQCMFCCVRFWEKFALTSKPLQPVISSLPGPNHTKTLGPILHKCLQTIRNIHSHQSTHRTHGREQAVIIRQATRRVPYRMLQVMGELTMMTTATSRTAPFTKAKNDVGIPMLWMTARRTETTERPRLRAISAEVSE